MESQENKANQMLAKLYNIEEYEKLEISKELDIPKLLKAKEYFQQQMIYYAELAGRKKEESIVTELRYQQARAYAKIKFMEKGDSATKAETLATTDLVFSTEKEKHAKVCGELDYSKYMFKVCQERVNACQQHISILSKEEQFNKFLKN